MLIGEAALRSPAFSPRLTLLLGELQAAGYTVWLEGLRLRFDCPRFNCAQGSPEAKCLAALMNRYRDVVEWLPEPRAELESAAAPPRQAARPRTRRRLTGGIPKTKPQAKPLS